MSQRLPKPVFLVLVLFLPLVGCDRAAVQKAFSADPNASRWGNVQGQLAPDFPPELRYPNAELQAARSHNRQAVQGQANKTVLHQTRWMTTTSGQAVQTFYQQLFQGPQWKLLKQESNQEQTILQARKQSLHVTVTIPNSLTTVVPQNPQSVNPAAPSSTITVPVTSFTLDYYRATSPTKASPQSGKAEFMGPPAPPTSATDPNQPTQPPPPAAITFTDLDQAPPEFQPYLEDLSQLGVLAAVDDDDNGNASTADAFRPNQTIQRGTFARWLVQANNRLYGDRPTRQIRLATATTRPAFKDVSPSHADFPYIQGLAEAGYLPSPLLGDVDQVLFRPEQPLTRDTLLTWKVPVDRRQILPTATADKVKQLWGFKDANRIAPTALAAVLADHANGDLANIRRLVGSALLFQPQKTVTRAEAAATLWFIGIEGEGFSARDIRRAERQTSTPPS